MHACVRTLRDEAVSMAANRVAKCSKRYKGVKEDWRYVQVATLSIECVAACVCGVEYGCMCGVLCPKLPKSSWLSVI